MSESKFTNGARVSFNMPGVEYKGTISPTADPKEWLVDIDPEFNSDDNVVMHEDMLTVIEE